MGEEPIHEPPLRGRGVVQFEDFCRNTGLAPDVVETLLRTELVEVSLWRDKERTRPFGIFDDVLPTRQALADMGLTVRADYDPEALRSYDEPTENDSGDA